MLKITALAIFMALLPCASVGVAAEREYQIKAAYLYNLVKFVEWPNRDSMEDKSRDLNICSFSHQPADRFIKALSGKSTLNNIIQVHIIKKLKTIPESCHILFIPKYFEQSNAALKSNSQKYKSILTVGESDNFINNNGLIALVLKNNRIHLKVNLTAAKQKSFRLSGKLLEIAEVIEQE